MRIKSCSIIGFGQLSDLEIDELGSSLVIIYGPNEAGKSTFFEFLKTMLYGIFPATPDNHPYLPWDARRLEGSLTLELSNGTVQGVHRKLTASADGTILAGKRQSIRNRPLPSISHVSKDLFSSVYALNLADLAGLEEKPWLEVQERLLGNLGSEMLRPVATVISELENKANSFWRSDRRGKPKERELRARLSELKKEATEAREDDKSCRDLNSRIAEFRARLGDLEEERIRLKTREILIKRIQPARKLQTQIRLAQELAGDIRELENLPESPTDRLKELKADLLRLKSEEADLDGRLAHQNQICASLTEFHRKLLRLAPEIHKWSEEAALAQHNRQLLDQAQRRTESALASLVERVRNLVDSELTAESKFHLRTLSLFSLRKLIQDLEDKKAELGNSLQQKEIRQAGYRQMRYLPLGLLFATLLWSALQLLQGSAGLPLAGGAAGAFIALLWAFFLHLRHRRLSSNDEEKEALLRSEVAGHHQGILQILAPIPLPKFRLESPDPYLVSDLQSLQAGLLELDSFSRESEGISSALEETQRKFQEWKTHHDIDTDGSLGSAVPLLEEALKAAQRQSQAYESAVREMEHLRPLKNRIRATISAGEQELEGLEERLRQLGDGDLSRGIRNLQNRKEAAADASQIRRVLTIQYPDQADLEAPRTDTPEGTVSEESSSDELAQIESRLEQISIEIKDLTAERAGSEKELTHRANRRSLADVESEISQVESERSDVCFKRDRLALLSRFIRMAEQQFREKHQPDVLRRASEYLKLISSERYTRLDFDENTRGLEAYQSQRTLPIPVVPPLSQGTRDQIYLALRFALVEHLDERAETIPLFLDEVFVNWDQERRRRGYQVVEKMLQQRQIFVLTCHDWFVDELSERFSESRVVNLAAAESQPHLPHA